MEQVLERGEKLELLVDKTEGLQHQVCDWWDDGVHIRVHTHGHPADRSLTTQPHKPTYITQAFKFERSSRQLRHAMLWQRLRCYILSGGIAAVVLFFIIGAWLWTVKG